VLFWRGRLSVSSKQGDVTLYYQPFWDGEVLWECKRCEERMAEPY
jgi:hypothetical protein